MNTKQPPSERTPKQIEAYLRRQAKRPPMGDCFRPDHSPEQKKLIASMQAENEAASAYPLIPSEAFHCRMNNEAIGRATL